MKSNGRVDVQSLVDTPGADTVALLDGHGGEAALGEACIWDQEEMGDVAAGELIFGVNLALDDAEELAPGLAAAKASAFAVKGDVDTLARLAALGADQGIAVLAVAASVSWDQFYAYGHRATTGGSMPDEPTPMSDLFALSNAIAANIGAAITIEDPAGGLLAYSNLDQPIDVARRDTILGRNNPEEWLRIHELN